MKSLTVATLLAALLLPLQGFCQTSVQPNAAVVTVTGQTDGPTPFISDLQLSVSDIALLRSVQFEVTPKTGSVTKPISAVYLSDYLQSRGYLNPETGQVNVPVFGLYPGYTNTVNLTYRFTDGTSQQDIVTITTPAFDDEFGYDSPTVLQARTAGTALSYDYIMIKSYAGTESPVILDTDGEVRWVGTSGQVHLSSIFFDNSIFMVYQFPEAAAPTGFLRMELDGTYTLLQDYSSVGVTSDDRHNADPGKTGILLEVDTTDTYESVVLELDKSGNILKTWNMPDIISAAMTAGGDDPSKFVYPSPSDWFHCNSATYRQSDDTIVISSRENFVIGLDYETGAIKWILGDPTKHWYQFASLRKYALALTPGSLPPIGQHAISFTHDDSLLVFDNGTNSMTQSPPGDARTYSSPRKYQIDTTAMTATEVWNYPNGESVYSALTSTVYEDDPFSYFIDYADIVIGGDPTYAEFLGLDPSGAKIFDYRYPINAVGYFAWNAIPIHLENLVFTGPQTTLTAGHPEFFNGETPLSNGVYYLDFPANGNIFGYYSYLPTAGYIYHFGLGYEYMFNAVDSEHGIYFYDFASQGYFYTSPQFPFPYLYDFNLGSVVYYYYDPTNFGSQRTFYNFSTGQIITK